MIQQTIAIKALKQGQVHNITISSAPGKTKTLWRKFTCLLVTICSKFLLQLKEACSKDCLIISSFLIIFYTVTSCSVPPWCLHSPKYLWSIRLGLQRASWSFRARKGIYNVALQNLDLDIRHLVLKSSLNSTAPNPHTCSHLSFLIASFLTFVSLSP